ncbi:MAG: hypothetical protein NXI32_26550 [bacterium]|nr:hypothetical protein [bacterium]
MRSIRSSVTLLLTVLSIGFAWNPEAHANPLRDASSEYKHAVKQFEIAIYRRGFDRPAKELIQELEEAAIRMRSASFHPQRLDRLECAWREVQYLHPRVEVGIFGASTIGRRCPDIELEQCWERVNCAFADLAQAVAYVCGPPAPLPPGTGFPLESSYPHAVAPFSGTRYGSPLQQPSVPLSTWSSPRSEFPGQFFLGKDEQAYSSRLMVEESSLRSPRSRDNEFDSRRDVNIDRNELRAMLMQTMLQRMVGGFDR